MEIYCGDCGYLFNDKEKRRLINDTINSIDGSLKVKEKHCPVCTLKFNDSDITSSINIIALLKSELGVKNNDEFYIEDIDEKLKISNNAIHKYIESERYTGWSYPEPETLEKILSGKTIFYTEDGRKKIMNFIDFFKEIHNLEDDEPFCLVFHSKGENKSIQKVNGPYIFKVKNNKIFIEIRDKIFTDIYEWQQTGSKWIQTIFQGLSKGTNNGDKIKRGYNVIKYSKLIFKEDLTNTKDTKNIKDIRV